MIINLLNQQETVNKKLLLKETGNIIIVKR